MAEVGEDWQTDVQNLSGDLSNLFPSICISSLQSIMGFDSAGGGSFVVQFDELAVNG